MVYLEPIFEFSLPDQALEKFKALMDEIAKTVKTVIQGIESATSAESRSLALS